MGSICTVSIIGRPNVGKSSLFNRLLKRSTKALTHDTPGVTRDRNYALIGKKQFECDEDLSAILVDTGGFYPDNKLGEELSRNFDENNYKNQFGNNSKKDLFFHLMKEHAKLAIEESDLVLFLVDIREGLNIYDQDIYRFLSQGNKPFLLVINKYDGHKQEMDQYPFYELGHDEQDTFLTSAAHGLGIDGLRDRLRDFVQNYKPDETSNFSKGVVPEGKVVGNISIIGAPNAGKSTLLNLLTQSQRSLVSPIAGTTVDPIEGYYQLDFKDGVKFLDRQSDKLKSNEMIGLEYKKFLETLENGEFTLQQLHEMKADDFDDDYDDNLDDEIRNEFAPDNSGDSSEETNEELSAEFLAEEMSEEDLDLKLSEIDTDTENSEVSPEVPVEIVDGIRSVKIVDTAGIRKKGQIKDHVESQSVYRSLRAISESDVVIYLMDATRGMTHHDRRLIDISFEKGKSVILVFNKFDLMRRELRNDQQIREWLLDVRAEAPWLNFCEIVTFSAKTGQNLHKLESAIRRTLLTRAKPISTSKLNFVISSLVEKNSIYVKGSRGKTLKVKYSSMVKTNPPTFLLFTNRSKNIPDNYKRYIKNGLRKNLGFKNTPLHLMFRTGKDLELREEKIQ